MPGFFSKCGAYARAVADHWERLLLLSAVIAFLGFARSSAKRPKMELTPEELSRRVAVAERHLARTVPRPIAITRYLEKAEALDRPVSAELYALAGPLLPVREIRRRGEPQVFAVAELFARAGRGAVRVGQELLAATNGQRPLQGLRWVMLTGVIRHQVQIEAFREALDAARGYDPVRDRPAYLTFQVQRAEIDRRRPFAEPAWRRHPVYAMHGLYRYWSPAAAEIVPSRFIPKSGTVEFVFSLPPIVGHVWGPEVVHPWILDASRQIAFQGFDSSSVEPEHLLVRYLDYRVDPGRQYRYRLRLVLANPNYRVPGERLQQSRWAEEPLLASPWSTPSSPVATPPDTEAVAVAANRRRGEATVRLRRFEMATGQVTAEEFNARPGQLLDYPDHPVSPDRDRVAPVPVELLGEMLAPSTRERPAARRVDFLTGLMLLAIQGGERLPGRARLASPVRLLLLDGQGNLVVREEPLLPVPAETWSLEAGVFADDGRSRSETGGASSWPVSAARAATSIRSN